MGMLGHEKASQIYAQLRYFALGDSDAGITPIRADTYLQKDCLKGETNGELVTVRFLNL